MLIDFHNSGLVAASEAIVGCREDSHDVALVTPVVSVHDELMGTGNSLQAICLVELLGDVLAEGVARTARRDAPTAAVIGVRPQQVANGALVGHFLNAIKLPNLIESVNGRGETAVQAENLILDDSSQGEVVKQGCENFPDFSVAVFAEAFIVEAIPMKFQMKLNEGLKKQN